MHQLFNPHNVTQHQQISEYPLTRTAQKLFLVVSTAENYELPNEIVYTKTMSIITCEFTHSKKKFNDKR